MIYSLYLIYLIVDILFCWLLRFVNNSHFGLHFFKLDSQSPEALPLILQTDPETAHQLTLKCGEVVQAEDFFFFFTRI